MLKKVKRAWEFISHADTVLALFGWFPWKSITVVVVGLMPAGLAIGSLPAWGIALVALVGLSMIPWGLYGLTLLYEKFRPLQF